MQQFERAPVEALHHHAVSHSGLADDGKHPLHKLLWCQRSRRVMRIDLGFHVEMNVHGAQILDQLEERRQRRDALPVAWPLIGKLPGIGVRRVEPADIIGLQLLQGHALDQRLMFLDPLPAGVPREGRIEGRVVRDHRNAFGADGDVQLQRGDAHANRVLERGQRVLRQQSAPAAVRLQIEGPCVRRGQQPQRKSHAAQPAHDRAQDL